MVKQRNKKKKGQSTLEYIILITGVVAILIVFLGPGNVFQEKVNSALVEATNGMVNMAKRLGGSRYQSQS